MIRPKLKVLFANPYGRELFYPNCEESHRLAKLMKVKSFTKDVLRTLQAAGHPIEINVPTKEIKI